MNVSGLAASLAVSVSVWLCTEFSKANNIVTCVCSMWWALATFSPPRLSLTMSGGWTVKLPHPTRAYLGGWVQKLLPPALLSGHFPLHSVAPFILLGCCPPVTAISLQMPSYCHRLPSSCCTPTSGMLRTDTCTPIPTGSCSVINLLPY